MILVTGAGGFIGREVCRQLVALGQPVLGVDRAASQPRQQSNLMGIELEELIEADLLDLDLRMLLRKVDGIVHLAGSPGIQTSWSDGFGTHLDNNVLTTQRLAEAMLDTPVRRMVVASSSSVYGNIGVASRRGCGPDLGADEDTPMAPVSPYGASKAAMEHVVGAYVQRGLDIIPLRYFTVYGPYQRPDMAMYLMINALDSRQPFTVRGDGTQQRNFTYVSDAASATVAALSARLRSGSPLNVGGRETVSVNDVLAILDELVGTPIPTRDVAAVHGDPRRTAADTVRAEALLRWAPQVSLRQGLAAQLDWQVDRQRSSAAEPNANEAVRASLSERGLVRPVSATAANIEPMRSTPQMKRPVMGAEPVERPSGIRP